MHFSLVVKLKTTSFFSGIGRPLWLIRKENNLLDTTKFSTYHEYNQTNPYSLPDDYNGTEKLKLVMRMDRHCWCDGSYHDLIQKNPFILPDDSNPTRQENIRN